MSDNFNLEQKTITLQPNDTKVPHTFTFSVCSSATANDGFLPYGTNIASVVVTAYNSSGTAVTATMVSGTPSVASNIVTTKLNYPGASGAYKLTMVATLDNGDATEIEADFTRVIAKDI